jgi:hypothetical protein
VEFYPRGEDPVDDLRRTHLPDDEYRILLHDDADGAPSTSPHWDGPEATWTRGSRR